MNDGKRTFEPTSADRKKVTAMAAVGVPHSLIAKRVGCTSEQLATTFKDELRRALPEMKAIVGASLFAAAKRGNIVAIIFWLKTRAGWKEIVRREIAGLLGQPIAISPRVIVPLPCNGRGSCPKIADSVERRAYYERILGHKLPVRDRGAA